MRFPKLTWPGVVALAAALGVASPVQGAEGQAASGLAAGNNAFALDLYDRLRAPEGNAFLSPYSISTCLGMTYAGARGETAGQMARVLHFTGNQDEPALAFGGLLGQLNDEGKGGQIELNVANGLWAQKEHPFLTSFLEGARTNFEALVNQVDFRREADPVRREINGWVEKKTRGRIPDLIPPGMITGGTRLVLVNAIYFKGRWTHPFDKAGTADAPFTVARDKMVQAPMMHQMANFNYAELDNLQLLELPYAGGDLSMVVLLPKANDGLKELEASLNAAQLENWLATGREQKVSVFLPRFKLTSQFSLAETLSGMGMTDAFTAQADFSGMDGARDLFISAVVHKAFVEVNEEGTEAAAATGAVMALTAVARPRPIPVFRADHPFLFLIRDAHNGSILFLGRVINPSP